MAEHAGEVHVAFNNNRGDDAPTAAQRFRALLGQAPPEPEGAASSASRRGAARTRRLGRPVVVDAPPVARRSTRNRPQPVLSSPEAPRTRGSNPGPVSVTSVRTAVLPIADLEGHGVGSGCRTLLETSSVTSRRSVSISGGSRSARSFERLAERKLPPRDRS